MQGPLCLRRISQAGKFRAGMGDEKREDTDRGSPPPAGNDTPSISGVRFAGFGVQFVAAILIFLYAGQWLDRKLGTSPLFLVVGVFVGAGGSFYAMYRSLVRPPKS